MQFLRSLVVMFLVGTLALGPARVTAAPEPTSGEMARSVCGSLLMKASLLFFVLAGGTASTASMSNQTGGLDAFGGLFSSRADIEGKQRRQIEKATERAYLFLGGALVSLAAGAALFFSANPKEKLAVVPSRLEIVGLPMGTRGAYEDKPAQTAETPTASFEVAKSEKGHPLAVEIRVFRVDSDVIHFRVPVYLVGGETLVIQYEDLRRAGLGE